ncbi:odorant receptor 85c-like [Anticarsia gemmatalis]|uniref:odorant receptor 85c-like n=1 Tax=Anticarsia gemmatalis TaxID=129554 RepID=UPI003F766920
MSWSELPSTYKKTFNHYLTLFKIVGIDFFDNSPTYLTWNNTKHFLFLVSFFPFITGQFYLVSKIRPDNFLETVRPVPTDVMFFIDLVKLLTYIRKKSEIRDMFLEIGELWPKGLGSDDKKNVILKAYLRRIRLPSDIFLAFNYANLTIFEVMPFIITAYNLITGTNEYVFPFPAINAWAHYNIVTFLLTYIGQVICTVPSQAGFYLPFDLTIATMTSNVSALLHLLQEDLKHAIKTHDTNKIMKQNIHECDSESYEEIKRIVDVHQKLLRLADKLSDIFGLVIFIHMAFASVEICFFGFLTLVCEGLADTVANLLTAMSAVGTIFLLSLSGQCLYDTSSEVADAAYQSLWYESDNNVRKLMLYIIVRAQQPSYLSALGFSQLTLKSFSKIMSTAWTYFSLLIQMYGDT